jgi:hypothetical protein
MYNGRTVTLYAVKDSQSVDDQFHLEYYAPAMTPSRMAPSSSFATVMDP